MIIGSYEIDKENQLFATHNATYQLDVLRVAKAPRRYLSSGVLISGLLVLFCTAFHDILWPEELAVIIAFAVISLAFSWSFTSLTFHSRDLTGASVTGALYGTHGHLNRIRREAMAAQVTNPARKND